MNSNNQNNDNLYKNFENNAKERLYALSRYDGGNIELYQRLIHKELKRLMRERIPLLATERRATELVREKITGLRIYDQPRLIKNLTQVNLELQRQRLMESAIHYRLRIQYRINRSHMRSAFNKAKLLKRTRAQ